MTPTTLTPPSPRIPLHAGAELWERKRPTRRPGFFFTQSSVLPLRSSPRRAFATATALVMLALLGTLALLMTRHLRDQAKRTSRDADQAQLRQLLHAGDLLASDLPKIWSTTGPQPQTLNLPLPKELTATGATLQVTTHPAPDGASATATITATLPPHRSQQTLTFHHSPQGWTLTSLQPN